MIHRKSQVLQGTSIQEDSQTEIKHRHHKQTGSTTTYTQTHTNRHTDAHRLIHQHPHSHQEPLAQGGTGLREAKAPGVTISRSQTGRTG